MKKEKQNNNQNNPLLTKIKKGFIFILEYGIIGICIAIFSLWKSYDTERELKELKLIEKQSFLSLNYLKEGTAEFGITKLITDSTKGKINKYVLTSWLSVLNKSNYKVDLVLLSYGFYKTKEFILIDSILNLCKNINEGNNIPNDPNFDIYNKFAPFTFLSNDSATYKILLDLPKEYKGEFKFNEFEHIILIYKNDFGGYYYTYIIQEVTFNPDKELYYKMFSDTTNIVKKTDSTIFKEDRGAKSFYQISADKIIKDYNAFKEDEILLLQKYFEFTLSQTFKFQDPNNTMFNYINQETLKPL